MSKQTMASEHWAEAQKLAKIRRLCEQATNYSFPAGQAQAGIQFGAVEVPWLLGYIEELKEEINERNQAAA